MSGATIYLSGPMTGIADSNFPAFHAAAAELRRRDFIVVNPAELNPEHGLPWSTYLRRDIAELVKCDGLALLPGWQDSRGACLERHIAEQLGMPVCRVQDLLGAAA